MINKERKKYHVYRYGKRGKADAGKIYVVDDRNVGGRNIGNINV